MLPVSAGKDDGFSSFGVAAGEGDIVDDVIDDARTTSDVNELYEEKSTREPTGQKAQ